MAHIEVRALRRTVALDNESYACFVDCWKILARALHMAHGMGTPWDYYDEVEVEVEVELGFELVLDFVCGVANQGTVGGTSVYGPR